MVVGQVRLLAGARKKFVYLSKGKIMSLPTRTAFVTAFVTVAGHEIGRTKTGGWSQSYITTPDGRTGLIDDEDMPVDHYRDITPAILPDVIAAVWHWED